MKLFTNKLECFVGGGTRIGSNPCPIHQKFLFFFFSTPHFPFSLSNVKFPRHIIDSLVILEQPVSVNARNIKN
jgi:hypothetical protein